MRCTSKKTLLNPSLPSSEPFFSRKNRQLDSLSTLGHFLKGSAAQLGVRQLKSSCAKIQLYGSLQEETDTGTAPISSDDALKRIRSLVSQARKEYHVAETELRRWYDDVPTHVDAL
jgi:HPt (histidine-containing phosphotransfer) domain-containing protein